MTIPNCLAVSATCKLAVSVSCCVRFLPCFNKSASRPCVVTTPIFFGGFHHMGVDIHHHKRGRGGVGGGVGVGVVGVGVGGGVLGVGAF